ncbi:hypothetical protein EXS70_05100, partial [Candidatus Peribacteria bacterium]|nr:hypothetical protein [Candidatus Peribacteria bacterium]
MNPYSSPEQQPPAGNPEQVLQKALGALAQQLQTATPGDVTVNVRDLWAPITNALRANPASLGQMQSILASVNGISVESMRKLIPTVDTAVAALTLAPDTKVVPAAQREILLKELTAFRPAGAPQGNADVQNKVKQSLAKLNTELASLKVQVDQAAKTRQVRKVAESLVLLRQASPAEYTRIGNSLGYYLDHSMNADQVNAALQGLEKQSEQIEKGLRELAAEVGPGHPIAGPNERIQRNVAVFTVWLNGKIDASVRDPGTREFIKEMLLGGFTDWLANFRVPGMSEG